MTSDISSEETAVVATYTNRHDAEVAKSFLEDQGIASFVVADDVHPPIQLTEGVRLFVMSEEAQNARIALEDAKMVGDLAPEEDDVSPRSDDVDVEVSRPARLTAWLYVAGFLLIVVAIIAGLLFSV